jgi:magnesium and cobalt exporter, CNNM family
VTPEDIVTLILVIVVASLVGSFLCSLCEAAFYAVTPTRVESLRQAGVFGSHKLGQLRGRIDEAIASILTVNSITQTIGAAWSGALVGEAFGNRWLGVFVGSFALVMLVFTEILPKSLGVAWAGALAPRVAWLIQGMIWMVWPLAKLTTLITRRVTRRAPGQEPTEEEVLIMADLAAEAGAILPEELRWLRNALRLNNVTAHELMTPRSAVYSVPADLSLDQIQAQAKQWVHSRLPVTESSDPERIVGVVQRRVVFDHLMRDEPTVSVRTLMRPALFVPEHVRGNQLLDRLISQRQHLAVVIDEMGRMTGVVSLEDVLEYLLGSPIVGEHDTHPDMQELARQRARYHARAKGPDSPTNH